LLERINYYDAWRNFKRDVRNVTHISGYVKLQTFVPHWNNFPGPDFSEVFLRDDICIVKIYLSIERIKSFGVKYAIGV